MSSGAKVMRLIRPVPETALRSGPLGFLAGGGAILVVERHRDAAWMSGCAGEYR